MKKNQQGFTLIELMIVIAIIAILMSYAIPAYRDYTIRTKLGEGNAMAASLKMAISEAYVRNGDLSVLNSGTNGIPAAPALGNCVNNMDTAAGVITVTFNCAAGSEGVADPVVGAASIIWTPTPNATGNTLQWTCLATGVTPGQDPC